MKSERQAHAALVNSAPTKTLLCGCVVTERYGHNHTDLCADHLALAVASPIERNRRERNMDLI